MNINSLSHCMTAMNLNTMESNTLASKQAIGNTDGRHLISISVLNDGMDAVDGEYLYMRSETPPVKGRQRQMGIASWLREHGYNAANGMPRLCFSSPMPDFA